MKWAEVYRSDSLNMEMGAAPVLRAVLKAAEACQRLARARVEGRSIIIEVRVPVPKKVQTAAKGAK